jgi:hypothetical protein
LKIDGGKIVFLPDQEIFPNQSELEVVVIRENQNPSSNEYTLAKLWVPLESWEDVEWFTRLNKKYRAIGSDHTVNGEPSTTLSENTIVEGTLEDIIRSASQKPGLGSHTYTCKLFGLTYKSKVTWEEQTPEEDWRPCNDPRPRHLQR